MGRAEIEGSKSDGAMCAGSDRNTLGRRVQTGQERSDCSSERGEHAMVELPS
jgi:hypothetical protein